LAENSLKIRIDGDASDYEKKLSGLKVKTKASLADIKAGIDMTTQAVSKLMEVASKGVNYNATLEQYRTSFEVMTGSAEKAADVVERLRTMGAETPFETTDLVQVTQLLMQYGFTADDAIEKMSMLGDIAQGNKEAMVSIATGYAQMSSAGKVNLQDIKQMINGGFNPLQEISERTGESMASLYDRISKGKMAISEITDSMRYATSEGGKFYQSMEKQSQTLNGQLSTLKDNAMQLLGSITEGMSENLASQMLPMVNNIVGELQTAFDEGGYQGLLDAATGMIPDLLKMIDGKFDGVVMSISRWGPKIADALMSGLPDAVKGASANISKLTTALFEVATTVATDLVNMLPELAPIVYDGILNIMDSALDGIGKMFTGIWDSVESLFHDGKKKIAGLWVDTTYTTEIQAGIDASIDTSEAENAIETAYDTIRQALEASPLTEEQKAELLDALGDDADAIKAKLMEFGMSDEDAAALAQTITDSGQTIIDAYDALNLGIDGETLLRLTVQANGSRILLKSLLKSEGLTDTDIEEVVKVYDEMSGKLGEQVPSLIEEIYDKLTDGKPDDDQTVEALTQQITDYIDELLGNLDDAYQSQLAELDPTAADYQQRKAELDAWYESAKTEIQSMDTEMRTLVSTLAGAPTKTVQARINEFIALEQRAAEMEERIEAVSGKAKSAAENAFAVVRSGAKTDAETVGVAIGYKITEFKLDQQSAEDAYNATMEQLNADLASGKIGKDEYESRAASAEADKQAAINAAQASLDTAMQQIFSGLAESSGTAAIWQKAAEKMNAADLLKSFYTSLDTQSLDYLGDDLKQQLADYLGTSVEGLDEMSIPQLKTATSGLATQFENEVASALENADTTMIMNAYQAALDNGLEGTSFNVESESAQLEAVMNAIINTSADAAKSTAATKSAEIGKASTSKMGDEQGARSAARETERGLITTLDKIAIRARRAGEKAGHAFASGYESTMEIQSPSKVMKRLGRYTGEGLEIGLNESMARAVRVANTMLGGLTTSADLTRMTSVNMPELRQEISIAAEQNKVPVNIDGRKVAEIQGQNNASQLAWLRARDARGYGQR
jgi:hypothetical protein